MMKNDDDYKRSLPQHVTMFKRTNDNWCGNFKVHMFTRYENGEPVEKIYYDCVEVSFNRSMDMEGGWVFIVTVSGNDDTMLQKSFESELDAWECFVSVIKLEFVDYDILLRMDFES